jgi:hypothetical protein
MSWQPIETAPENTFILTYSPANSDEPYAIDKWRWHSWTEQNIESESANAKGKRKVIHEITHRERNWEANWGAEFWMPLPDPPVT